MASLLGKLRYQFLKESLDFVAVHRLRLVQVLLLSFQSVFFHGTAHIVIFFLGDGDDSL